jgi:hypothetical protein
MPLLFETTQQTTYCKSRSTQVPDPGLCWPRIHIRSKIRRSGRVTYLGYSG